MEEHNYSASKNEETFDDTYNNLKLPNFSPFQKARYGSSYIELSDAYRKRTIQAVCVKKEVFVILFRKIRMPILISLLLNLF